MAPLTVILPTYQEAENIGPLLRELRRHLPTAELLVIDDNSPDATAEVARRAHSEARVIVRTGERGLVTAIARGIAEAGGDVIAWMDCDFSMPPEVVPQLLERIRLGADVAVGSRYAPGGADHRPGFTRRFTSWLVNRLARLTLDPSPTDYTTGFVAARRRVLTRVPIDTSYAYGEYCIDFLYRCLRAGFAIDEVGYVCTDRSRGWTKTAPDLATFVRRGIGYLRTLARLRRLPAAPTTQPGGLS